MLGNTYIEDPFEPVGGMTGEERKVDDGKTFKTGDDILDHGRGSDLR